MAIHSRAVNHAHAQTVARRGSSIVLSTGLVLLSLLAMADCRPGQGAVDDPNVPAVIALPPGPVATKNSLELCLNSRYSEHTLGGVG
jgi:hypothetical protein